MEGVTIHINIQKYGSVIVNFIGAAVYIVTRVLKELKNTRANKFRISMIIKKRKKNSIRSLIKSR